MRTYRDTYLLYIGVVVALVPVMVLRDFTPDNELRYLSIADEALRRWKTTCPLQQFFLTVGVVTFVLLSCISGKLQIYMLPALPFLIYGAALSLGHAAPARWQRVALGLPCVALALALPAVYVAGRMGTPVLANTIPVYVAAIFLTIGGVAALVVLWRHATASTLPRAVRCTVAGMQRDFTYIDDIVEGVLRLLLQPPSGPVPHAVYNIGHSSPVPLMDFIHTIEHVSGRRATMIMEDMQPGDVYRTYADTTRLQHVLGYHPSVSVTDGVARFYDWYRAYAHVE